MLRDRAGGAVVAFDGSAELTAAGLGQGFLVAAASALAGQSRSREHGGHCDCEERSELHFGGVWEKTFGKLLEELCEVEVID